MAPGHGRSSGGSRPVDVAGPALQPGHQPDRDVPVLHPGVHVDQRPRRPRQRDPVHQPRAVSRGVRLQQDGLWRGHRLAALRPGPGPAVVLFFRPEARLLRGTDDTTAPRCTPRLRDRGPIARAYRRYLGRASLFMFAMLLVSAFLLPLAYMVTTAFQQPGKASTPGAPVYPAAPQTGTYRARSTRSTRSRSTGRPEPDAGHEGPRTEHLRRPW